MTLLVAGLLAVLGVHAVPAFPALRAALVRAMGRPAYIAAFAVASTAGFVLLVWGYAVAPRGEQLFGPWVATKHAARVVVALAFVLVAASMMRTHLRRFLGHPGYIGVGVWAAMHLLANGHARATLLFGAILLYSALGFAAVLARGAGRDVVPDARFDVLAVVLGLGLAVLMMGVHWRLIGVPVVAWSF